MPIRKTIVKITVLHNADSPVDGLSLSSNLPPGVTVGMIEAQFEEYPNGKGYSLSDIALAAFPIARAAIAKAEGRE